MNPSIDLNLWVRDVTGLIEAEELSNVVLVGHSFGGCVITGVADRMPERLAKLVFLDAVVATSGVSPFGEVAPEVRDARMRSATMDASGTRVVTPPPATAFGIVNEAQLQWVNRRLSPMPFKVYDTSLTLRSAPGGTVPKRCTQPAIVQGEPGARYAKANGWNYLEIARCHEVMVIAPGDLAKALM